MNSLTLIAKPLAVLLLLLTAACAGEDTTEDAGRESEADLVARALGIHERVITLDTHNDINPANFTAEQNYTMDIPTQVTLPKMEAGGLDVSWMVVYVGQGELTDEGFVAAHKAALDKFAAIHRLTEELAPERIGLALTSEDVRRIAASGRKVVMIGIENAYQVGTDLTNIRKFHELGGRYMSLAHNGHNQFSDSHTGEQDDVWLHGGLSDLGRDAIVEMNRWGIMIDISHPSKVAIMQMLELSRAPVIASHSSARALNDVSRNLDDEQLMALKKNGGVVQTVAFESYLNSEKNQAYRDALTALQESIAEEMDFEMVSRPDLFGMSAEDREVYREAFQPVQDAVDARMDEVRAIAPPVGVSDLADHIDYLVNLIGIAHVGISSDFDGGGGVEGWRDASETFTVTLELVRRGYTEEQIGMIWSGNLLRVLDEVQAVAAEIQSEGQ